MFTVYTDAGFYAAATTETTAVELAREATRAGALSAEVCGPDGKVVAFVA